MANEDQKLREATYFFGIMKTKINDRNAFVYNFSAFITASRSIVQYAFEECRSDASARAWYDDYISNTDLIRYFKNKRDINIHESPLIPNAAYSVKATVHLAISGGCSVKVMARDANGNFMETPTPMSDEAELAIVTPTPTSSPQSKESVRYFLQDRRNDDLVDLAENYINELTAFLCAARAAGHVPTA